MGERALEPWRPRKHLRGQSSPSSAALDLDYDVFLNHRGPDEKAGFMAHLDEALRAAGLNPFLDKASLRKGDPAFRSIDDALEVAKVHVAVVSKGYAESKYCLTELVSMMRSGKPVIPVFYDVEPGHLRWVENGPFAAAFKKHKSRNTPEQVQEWADALRNLANITGFCFRLSDCKGDEAELKREVVNVILTLIPRNEALQVQHHLVGVEEHMNTCIDKLGKMSGGTCFLGLVGMGGIGKTSLAKAIYNHFVGWSKFQAMSFLAVDCNSPSSMEVGPHLSRRLQKQLLWDLLHVPDNNWQSYKSWFHKLSNLGPILVVLDDIHERRQFDELILDTNLLAQGSCIIVTSRDRHLVTVIAGESNMYLHEVTPLGCDDSQKLFNLHAFGSEEAPTNLKPVANDVIKACGGLPLALKVVGCSLFDKRSDEDIECIWPEAVDALKGDPSVVSALKWSYECLSEPEKLMFVDIACIFCGWRKQEALEIWKSCKECSSCCGFGTPYTTLRGLIDKSLVVLEGSSVSDVLAMHSLLQDLGQGIGLSNGSHLWEGKATKVVEDKNQVVNKVRALNLANMSKRKLEAENLAKMTELHFLVLDGREMSGDLGSISKELRWLRWRYMPLLYFPSSLSMSKLVSLDFSKSSKLASLWAESALEEEACPNLLRLKLRECTSITSLPDSIGHFSRLEVLDLGCCMDLQKLPSSIGRLTTLQVLHLDGCGSLEALPDTITALSGLQRLVMVICRSLLKVPATLELMTGLMDVSMDLATEWQAIAIGQFNSVKNLVVAQCTDEAITMLDSLVTLRYLGQLVTFIFGVCPSMTKLPETIDLLTSLEDLHLFYCERLRELPNSIGQLKVLKRFHLRYCNSLETLPESLGELTNLQELSIVQCTSMTKLPTSIGSLSSLLSLRIEDCGELQPLPESIRHLNALVDFTIMDCGSLEGLGLLRVLQGLRIWGCTRIAKLLGSCLNVVDSSFIDPARYFDWKFGRQNLKKLRLVEANDCGFLRVVQEDSKSGRLIFQRVYKLPCCKSCGPVGYSFIRKYSQEGGEITIT